MYFCVQNVVDFLEGKTMYSTEHVPISLHDIPTMTICLSAKENLGIVSRVTKCLLVVGDFLFINKLFMNVVQ